MVKTPGAIEHFAQSVVIRTASWAADTEVHLPLARHWIVSSHSPAFLRPLSECEVDQKLRYACDNGSLRCALKPDARVAIVVDDHTRPTPVGAILGRLLPILYDHQIPPNRITLVVALGTHILMNDALLQNKLRIVYKEGLKIIYHDCCDAKTCVFSGFAPNGMALYVNRHYAEADVKITISGVYPHDEAGFSGGAKILIGILPLTLITRLHRMHGFVHRATIETPFRTTIERFADTLGLHLSINCLIDERKNLVDLYCGDFRQAMRTAATVARRYLGTTPDTEPDIVICNNYPFDSSLSVLGKGKWPFKYAKARTRKILVSSLCNRPFDREPFASSPRERLIQRLKAGSGGSWLKRHYHHPTTLFLSTISRSYKWRLPYVVHIPYIHKSIASRPHILDKCIVEYNWASIIQDLLGYFGNDYPARVSIYQSSSLLFPGFDDRFR